MTTARTSLIVAALALTFDAPPALGQQIDLSGMWSATLGNHEELPLRGDPGVEVGEYVGIPLNDAARQHAETWTPTMHSLLEWQGRPHPVTYAMRAPRPDFRMGAVVDPKTERLIAYTITGLFGRADRTIWLDGRPHPSKYAEHQWQGFSTGEWIGGGLKVTTATGWFAARPSGTEEVYKLYAESFTGPDHLRRIQEEAQALIRTVFEKGGAAAAEA